MRKNFFDKENDDRSKLKEIFLLGRIQQNSYNRRSFEFVFKFSLGNLVAS